MTLTNIELFDIAKKYNIIINSVVQKDNLKTITPKMGFYIVNLQSESRGNGSHWVCIVLSNKNQNIYFDSFGAPAPIEVQQFMRRYSNNTRYYWNNWIIQDINSVQCGWFVMGFFIYVIQYSFNSNLKIMEIFNNYVNMFVDNTKKNDMILAKYFHSFTKRDFELIDNLYNNTMT